MKKTLLLVLCFISATTSSANLDQTVGLFLNTEEAFEGYTLFAGMARDAYLIDNCGKLVNYWEPTTDIALSQYLHTDGYLYRSAKSPELSGMFAGGVAGAVEILDWESNLIWEYDFAEPNSYHSHHDIEVLPNGNILVLAWDWKDITEADSMGRITPQVLWPTILFEVEPIDSAEANFVWTWRLWDHLIQDADTAKVNFGVVSQHPELFNINEVGFSFAAMGSDWIHCNTVEYIPEFDQIVLSAKHISEVWVIDHSTTTEEAASHSGGTYGKGGDFLYRWGNSNNYKIFGDMFLNQQHDVSWIPLDHPTDPGKFMVFNNGQMGRIDMWTPPQNPDGSYIMIPGEVTEPFSTDWSYNSDADSPVGCSARRLANGNTLYADYSGAIMKEINPDEELVWHYVSPISSFGAIAQGESIVSGHTTFRAERYPIDYPGFAGKDMTPQDPIELNPLDYDCITSQDSTDVSLEEFEDSSFSLFPNPSYGILNIESKTVFDSYKIYDIHNTLIRSASFDNEISIFDLNSGLYFLELQFNEKRKISIFIKE